MSFLIDIASWILLACGGVFCVVGGIGLLRMPDFYTRVHAASVTETLGGGLILAGVLLAELVRPAIDNQSKRL